MATDSATKAKALPQRSEIAEKDTWKLEDIYTSEKAFQDDFERARTITDEASRFKGKLEESSATLYECFNQRSELQQIMSALFQYAYLSKDLDNRVAKYQEMMDKVAMLASEAATAFSYVEPELLLIDEKTLRALADGFPKTDIYDFYIKELIRSRKHIRSQEVEEVLAMSTMIARGPSNIFTMLDDADMKYPSIIDEDGNEVQLTKQRYAKFLDSADRRVRRDANEAFYTSYRNHSNTIAASLSAAVNQDVFYSRVRSYESCLHSALDGDNIPVSVYHNLLDTTEEKIEALHGYTALRQKLLKLDDIYPYDMLCPLFPDFDYKVPYDEAVQSLLTSFEPLGKDYLNVLTDAFKSRWIDVYETEGKGSGAYSYGDNVRCHPFVLMNYNDTVDSMFTLAHEMGHAMHSYLANKTQPHPKARYSIFVAEVASTLNEGLLLHHLLGKATEKGARLYLMNKQLSGAMGTYYHQVMYAHFELAIHEHVEKGGALSSEFMSQLWSDLTKKYYGPQLHMDEDTPLKWSRIPHFYRGFYVYQYATSFAASQAILKKFLDGEPGIIEKYLTMLASGGSDYPIELLKICGVDMTTKDPFVDTVGMFDALTKEMSTLV